MEIDTAAASAAPWHAHHVRSELRSAVRELTSRGLKQSAVWASELLLGLGSGEGSAEVAAAAAAAAVAEVVHTRAPSAAWTGFDSGVGDTDRLLMAKAYFDLGEFLRCAHALSPGGGGLPDGGHAKEAFLWAYSMYLAGERRKEEEMCELSDPLEQSQLVNANLKLLRAALCGLHREGAADGFVLYLYGVVLKEMDSPAAARGVLCEAVSAYPLNWSAWVDLAELCTEHAAVAELEGALPAHWATAFFRGHVLLELQQNEEAVALYTAQGAGSPVRPYMVALRPLMFLRPYWTKHLHEFNLSETITHQRLP